MSRTSLSYLFLFALFCMGPLAVIFAVSVTEARALTFPPQGFSFRWFVEIFSDEAWFTALRNSVLIALSAATLATFLALPISYYAWRHGLRFAKALAALGVLPFLLPPVILSLGLLLLFTSLTWHGYFINGVLAHTIYLIALPIVIVSLGLESIERSVLEAGSTLGADDAKVFRTIVVPLTVPFVITAFAFCIVLSLNEYIIMLMTVGFTYETLPIKIFNALRYGYSPVLASVAVMFTLLNIAVFGAVAVFSDLPKLLGATER